MGVVGGSDIRNQLWRSIVTQLGRHQGARDKQRPKVLRGGTMVKYILSE